MKNNVIGDFHGHAEKLPEVTAMSEPSTTPASPQSELVHELPATVDAAVHRLLAMLPEADKVEIAAKSQAQLIELYFGLGTWIRNNFGLWQGNAALAQDAGTNEPDDIAGVIIEALWNRLRGDESKRGDNLPASPMPSTAAPSAGSSFPKKRPPKKLAPGMQEFGDMAMAAMLKNLNRPGDH